MILVLLLLCKISQSITHPRCVIREAQKDAICEGLNLEWIRNEKFPRAENITIQNGNLGLVLKPLFYEYLWLLCSRGRNVTLILLQTLTKSALLPIKNRHKDTYPVML